MGELDITPIITVVGPNEEPLKLEPGTLSCALRRRIGDRLRFNRLAMAAELDGHAIPGHAMEDLYIALSERGWTIEKNKAQDALLRVARQRSYHPVVEYLEHLEHDESIAAVDLDRLASTYLGTADQLYDEMLAATLIGAVARALNPGCKFDTCCVLRGDQGAFKSTTWQALASPAWFCDTSQANDKDLKMAIHATWIYELAELDGMTSRKEAADVKAILSSPTDRFRPPYARTSEVHPRQSIFVGSCNRDDFLRDETGSRRFWVIEIPKRIDHSRITADRDQIWRAAVLAYRSGRLPILSAASQAESERRNKGYEPEHPWLAILARWLPSCPQSFTADEALTRSGCVDDGRLERRHQMEVAPLLRALGCEREPHQSRDDGGQRARRWRLLTQPVSTSAQEVETAQTPDQHSDLEPLSQPLNLKVKSSTESSGGAVGSEKVSPFEVERLRQNAQTAGQHRDPAVSTSKQGRVKVETWHGRDQSLIGSGADVMDGDGDDPHWPKRCG